MAHPWSTFLSIHNSAVFADSKKMRAHVKNLFYLFASFSYCYLIFFPWLLIYTGKLFRVLEEYRFWNLLFIIWPYIIYSWISYTHANICLFSECWVCRLNEMLEACGSYKAMCCCRTEDGDGCLIYIWSQRSLAFSMKCVARCVRELALSFPLPCIGDFLPVLPSHAGQSLLGCGGRGHFGSSTGLPRCSPEAQGLACVWFDPPI